MSTINTTYYPYYGFLTPVQQSVYEALLPDLMKATKEISITIPCTCEDGYAALEAIYYDHPEIFWITGGSSSTYLNDKLCTLLPTYNGLEQDLEQNRARFHAAADAFLSKVTDPRNLDKERHIHDLLARNISYEHGTYDQSAYSALVERKTVCAGYGRAFQYLMQRIGIPCYHLSGESYSKKEDSWERHGWSIVKLGEEYYHVDVTWDDDDDEKDPSLISYTYYHLTDDEIANNHKRGEKAQKLPACNGTRYRFEHLYGMPAGLHHIRRLGVTTETVVKDQAMYQQVVTEAIQVRSGKTVVVSFATDQSVVYDNASEWLKPAVKASSYNGGWTSNVHRNDPHSGWYRIEITLNLKK